MSLYQLIYQSQSLVPFETAELLALLEISRANNRRRHLTGILLYTPDGRFLQVLEGEHEDVQYLYHQRILTDPRHFNCRIIAEGPCQQRVFSTWSMGFREAQAHNLRTLLSNVPPNNPALLIPRPHTRPELLDLIRAFVADGTVAPSLEHPA